MDPGFFSLAGYAINLCNQEGEIFYIPQYFILFIFMQTCVGTCVGVQLE